MKKAILVLVMMIFILNSAAAETVLCCISDNRQQMEPTPWSVMVLRTFEDGVMDVFFEAGHIVTNSFLNECKSIAGDGVESNSEVAGIMGNRLGADCVLILELIFPTAVPGVLPVPEVAEYSLFTNAGKTLTVESSVVLEIAVERGEEELLDSFTTIGKNIASELVSKL